jgi:hypothetical protein
MRVRTLCVALVLSLLAPVAVPQSIFDFDDWMQRIDEGSQDLQRQIDARDVPAASASAREIEELYGLMETFFEKRGNAADAVRWSREGREFATRALTELGARRFSAARRHALAIAHGCRDCHYQYKPL